MVTGGSFNREEEILFCSLFDGHDLQKFIDCARSVTDVVPRQYKIHCPVGEESLSGRP